MAPPLCVSVRPGTLGSVSAVHIRINWLIMPKISPNKRRQRAWIEKIRWKGGRVKKKIESDENAVHSDCSKVMCSCSDVGASEMPGRTLRSAGECSRCREGGGGSGGSGDIKTNPQLNHVTNDQLYLPDSNVTATNLERLRSQRTADHIVAIVSKHTKAFKYIHLIMTWDPLQCSKIINII